jgi:ubiquinone/menaquinone biosynthesis C-methylase UbiE
MEPALQRRVQRYGWDKASDHYETFWQRQLKPAQDMLLAMLQLQAGEKIIDIACGTGLVSFPAADKVGNGGFVLGTDISDRMVEMAASAAKEKNYSHVQFERMDAEELKAADESYDAAICALGLMYIPDPVKALKEMYRVLKPGGRAVAAVWGQRDHCGWADIFEIVDRRVSSEVCPMFFNLGNITMLDRSFEAAGFSGIISERINTRLVYTSAEEACGAAFAGGPVALAYFKFSDAVKEEVENEYLDSILPFRQNNGYAVPGEFVVAMGYKK